MEGLAAAFECLDPIGSLEIPEAARPLAPEPSWKPTSTSWFFSALADDKYATRPGNVALAMFSPLFRAHPLQKKPEHFWVWSAAGLYNKVSVCILCVGVRALVTEVHQKLVGLEDNTHSNLPHDCEEHVVGLIDRRFAVFMKSASNALPLDVVTIVASLAAFQPIRKCFAVNACFGGCAGEDGTFLEGLEDTSHALR